jgi:hypothetical protein
MCPDCNNYVDGCTCFSEDVRVLRKIRKDFGYGSNTEGNTNYANPSTEAKPQPSQLEEKTKDSDPNKK